ncbi:unnamed protein product [Acanthoscelides obtectus]|uniref:Uncharacterized protein n=1 Tax=Acanthoscelides obtectus TaxID=200917 RepID=A0A9P0P4E5_ACAOB|nr:unnamed protein product [Acanthoscelides obtectus]CAK1629401.1 hypothetical protein AOBTE_LOCUS5720 [Acanthoscelides obtectus]
MICADEKKMCNIVMARTKFTQDRPLTPNKCIKKFNGIKPHDIRINSDC